MGNWRMLGRSPFDGHKCDSSATEQNTSFVPQARPWAKWVHENVPTISALMSSNGQVNVSNAHYSASPRNTLVHSPDHDRK
jgi:hypothetical protein